MTLATAYAFERLKSRLPLSVTALVPRVPCAWAAELRTPLGLIVVMPEQGVGPGEGHVGAGNEAAPVPEITGATTTADVPAAQQRAGSAPRCARRRSEGCVREVEGGLEREGHVALIVSDPALNHVPIVKLPPTNRFRPGAEGRRLAGAGSYPRAPVGAGAVVSASVKLLERAPSRRRLAPRATIAAARRRARGQPAHSYFRNPTHPASHSTTAILPKDCNILMINPRRKS
jgi:hypothetical protein